ncbi:MAG: hypothetical protein K2O14_10920 [Oscillospiraceae bacterium]|nr:hypothetical protein [Oscillospiraceae bacterium]
MAKLETITDSKPDEGHVFVDFEYIENAEGITDPEKAGEWLDRALEALWETENYKTFEEYVQSEDFDREKFADYVDENGNPAPRFEHAFIEDFDGNNTEEAFVVVTMPVILPYFDYWKVRYFLIYTGDSNTKLFERLPQIFGYDILDYGVCKQLVVYTGGLGVETGSTIYGVSGDVPDVLYSFRGSYQKVDCFLSAAWGWQGSGDFMYYDTAAKEYRAIMGRDMSFDDWFAMDTSGSIDEEKRNELVSNPLSDSKVIVIGGKYYCVYYGWMDTGEPYTYENGVFTYLGVDSGIRISKGYTFRINCIEDIDYDAAVASMLTPAQAALL